VLRAPARLALCPKIRSPAALALCCRTPPSAMALPSSTSAASSARRGARPGCCACGERAHGRARSRGSCWPRARRPWMRRSSGRAAHPPRSEPPRVISRARWCGLSHVSAPAESDQRGVRGLALARLASLGWPEPELHKLGAPSCACTAGVTSVSRAVCDPSQPSACRPRGQACSTPCRRLDAPWRTPAKHALR